ncbi:hypothetical protein SteCoe_6464 [Stentor coeruleus]|uniref:Uncharacterized protein n=1 Tax=Stentor coeruleus TaxID=5963 RepID=A0A1R2CQ19_9CILI|nr:hypothetical protein SteCoe_6464 [Stentor coeruleus]
MTSNANSAKELDEIDKPSALMTLVFTYKSKTSLAGLEKFKNLIELDLTGNRLFNPVFEITQLKFLKKLNVSKNNISSLWDLPKSLEKLVISANKLTTLDLVIPTLSRLQSLDISYNQITSLSPLRSLSFLQCLYASHNQISSLLAIDSFPALLEIDLESNSIPSTEICYIESNQTLCAISLKNNPIMHDVKHGQSQIFGFVEMQDGLFLRHMEKIKSMGTGKLKLFCKKNKKDENIFMSKKPVFSSRNTSMQEIYEQVIDEDPEMEESFNTSESEERGSINSSEASSSQYTFSQVSSPLLISFNTEKSPGVIVNSEETGKKTMLPIAKLQLEKITEKPTDKISYEKWSTKPESSIEFLFEDLITYCGLNELIDKSLNSCDKYEYIVNILKQREDQRKNSVQLCEELKAKVTLLENKNMELKKKRDNLKQKLKDKEGSEDLLSKTNLQLNDTIERLKLDHEESFKGKQELIIKEERYKERIKTLEDELKNSSRFNFSCSFESDASLYNNEYPEIEYRKYVLNNQAFVPNEVADYIKKLLQKITKQVSKSKKLRIQRDQLKAKLEVERYKSHPRG